MFHQGQYFPKNVKKYKGNLKNIYYRSGWELKMMQHFDFNPNILEWSSEELGIPYYVPEDNSVHRYFPDFIVKLKKRDGSIHTYMYEVKPKKQTAPPKKPNRNSKKYIQESFQYYINDLKWKAATNYCKQLGWTFALLTEDDIGM
jgi:hypothetical protein